MAAYEEHRNNLVHGVHGATFESRGSKHRTATQQRMQEIARLTVLGMLGYSNANLARLLPFNASTLQVQQALDAMGTAPTDYLADQQRWA